MKSTVLDASFATYERIIDLTIEQHADAFLVAGDAYDGDDRSLRAQLAFVEGLERLDSAGIHSFICHGQHDRLDEWTARLRFPKRAHRFGPGIEVVPLDTDHQVEVIGISQPHSMSIPNLAREFEEARNSAFSIGLLAADVTGEIQALNDSSLTYWALGSIHRHAAYRDQRPAIAYPGSPQGHHPEETGPRGAYVVDIDRRGRITRQFHHLDTIRWIEIQVNLTGIPTQPELFETVERRIERQIADADNRAIIYRLIFEGHGPLAGTLADTDTIADIVARLNDDYGDREVFAWCHHASYSPGTALDADDKPQTGDVIGALLRLSDEFRNDGERLRQLEAELAPLLEDPRFLPYRDEAGLSDRDMVEIINEAEARLLAELGSTE
ncbi:MAG: hypothetical protein R2849_14620 [Thermomicrobiales bacterium]